MQKISAARSFKSKSSRSGFTLIEVMIVLAILGLMLATGVQRLNRGQNIKNVVRQLSTTAKEVRTRARLNNTTYRFVINMDDNEGHSYWVEKSSSKRLLPSANDSQTKSNNNEEEKSDFDIAPDVTKKPKQLASGYYFTNIQTSSNEEPISSGKAFVYFLPQGVSEEAVIQITNRDKTTWSILIKSLVSQPEIVTQAISLQEYQAL